MILQSAETKVRKPRNIKASKPQTTSKKPTTIHLSIDSLHRLGVHATMEDMDKSSVVEDLIQTYLKKWVTQNRGGCDTGEDRQSETAA